MNRIHEFFQNRKEPNQKWYRLERAVILLCLGLMLTVLTIAFVRMRHTDISIRQIREVTLERCVQEEELDEEKQTVEAIYQDGEQVVTFSYSYEDYLALDEHQLTAFCYECEDGTRLYFNQTPVTESQIEAAYRQQLADRNTALFALAFASGILALAVSVISLFGAYFRLYEKVWFISIMFLACVVSLLFPEESANGISGLVIMLLYLLDTFLNILCELLISKQNRYNFLVSVGVEITEIAICMVLMYRFATLASTLFFWLPIDILSFINWSKHKDDEETELTVVRKLKGYQQLLVIAAIVLWTLGVGYLLSGLDIASDFIPNKTLETAVIYIDACASAVGIANGLFIFFRMQEQWLAWYACTILEAIINVLTGQYILLVLKLGYLTNTTYGYLRWNHYIQTHKEAKPSLF